MLRHLKSSAQDVRTAIAKAKRERSRKLDLGYERFTDGQLTDSWATGIFPNVQIGLHPEGAFLMRFMPHPTDPEKFYYDTMTLIKPVNDPDYNVPGWMGLPEGTDTSGEDKAGYRVCTGWRTAKSRPCPGPGFRVAAGRAAWHTLERIRWRHLGRAGTAITDIFTRNWTATCQTRNKSWGWSEIQPIQARLLDPRAARG